MPQSCLPARAGRLLEGRAYHPSGARTPAVRAVRMAAILWLAVVSTGPTAASEYLDQDDPLYVDIEDSLEYGYSEPGRLTFDGDLRSGYFATDVDQRDGTSDSSDEFALRVRYGMNVGISDRLRLKARLASVCTDSDCSPAVDVSRTPANTTNIDNGDIVLDELYLDLFESDRWDLGLGRMQTRAVTRGGVFVSSLTRLTSTNVSVNWTDGLALRYVADSGWQSHAIVQYNDSDGSSTLARAPLDFDDDDSRVSYFYSLENREPWGPFTQRAIDVSYLPSALLTDGDASGPVDDYWNLAGRFAAQWPAGAAGRSLIVSGELGWAPETPSELGVGTGTDGDADGIAWHLEATWMNFLPDHHIGINYARTDPGWLISPVYRANEETLVLRYHWRPVPRLQLEVQSRWREELDALVGAARKRDTFDWRVRLTWRLEQRTSRW